MKKRQRKFRANSSGQLLIVASLAIGILISSTAIYVYELSKETNSEDYSSISNFVLALKQSTRNAMISSLANVSNGGEKSVLAANLDRLSQIFRNINNFGICQLAFTLLSDSNYDAGTWLSWNISDMGVSSTYANFTLEVYGMAMNVTLNYAVNVTSTITINGYFTKLNGDEKLVNLTCNVYNEGKPALAKNMTFFYEEFGSWLPIDLSNDLSIMDYGNGTYRVSFTVSTPSDTLEVSARIYDVRDIFVQANTTCYET
jgi:hypothetical protein